MTRAALLLTTGAVFALALFALGAQDLGDPAGAARAQLAREAEAEARVAMARWAARLGNAEPLAAPLGRAEAWTDDGAPLPAGLTEPRARAHVPDEVERAVLAVAATRLSAGDPAGAAAALEALLAEEASGGGAGETALGARLAALRLAAARDDRAAVERHLAALRRAPFELTVDGASARLAASLAASRADQPEALAAELRAALAQELAAALRTGALAVGAPRDALSVDAAGARVVLDPELGALRALLDERLPLPDTAGWRAVFAEDSRAAAVLRGALESAEQPADTWVLRRALAGQTAPPGAWIAVRLGAVCQLALHDERALTESFEGGLSAPWRLATGADGSLGAAEAFGPELAPFEPLQPLRIAHPDPEAPIAGERRRLAVIRTALFGLGAALLAVSALGARAARRAARLVELRRTFVASVSHDLRTPLASISGLTENLLDGVVGGAAAQREYHAAIGREAARLRRLVEGLLDFARLERGELPRIQRAAVELAPWTAELVRAATDLCAPHTISVEATLGPLPATYTFDADAARRAVLNLVENAVRHSGTDTVALAVVCDGALVVSVADRGRGLAEGAGDLFAPYVTRGTTGGTGLGLSIVRALAAAHGGTATLAPRADGPGLVATLTLPDDTRIQPDGETAA